MKKEYKRPSIEVVKIEQTLLQAHSLHDTVSDQPSYAPGYSKGRGRGRYEEDDFDEEEEEDL